MTKNEALEHICTLYRAFNTADSDCKAGDWMHPALAGKAGCVALDDMLHQWQALGILTADEAQRLYDTDFNA